MIETLKKRNDFVKTYNKKKSFGNRNLVLYINKNNLYCSRVGITISKKVGKATVRNKIRRRMKEICRAYEDRIKDGYDLVFVIKKNVPDISFQELEGSFLHMLKISKMRKV